MNNITLITCSYNTPVVTANMLKSFISLHPKCKILVCDNSTDDSTRLLLQRASIPFIINEGGLHAPSVDILLRNVTTSHALLVDTDVIFMKDHCEIYDQFVRMNLTLMGDIEGDRGGKRIHLRVHPWHCFINVDHVKQHKLNFYDKVRMMERGSVLYDVGSSFFEDVKKLKLKIADFKGGGSYYRHYEGMSWRVGRFGAAAPDGDIDNDINATHCNQALYEYGMHVERLYARETQHIAAQKLSYEA
jgi:hypothetical protein